MVATRSSDEATLNVGVQMPTTQLQKDILEAQRLMKSMGASANDNFGAMSTASQKFSRDVSKLKESIDPAYASYAKLGREALTSARAVREGALTAEEATAHLAKMRQRLQEAGDGMQRVTTMTGMQRAGMSQLAMNLSDVSTMYNLGAKTSQIFASQSGQVVQAVIMLAGETSKFALFMQGPWGIALTAGTLILAPFIGKLFETEEKTTKAEKATRSFAETLRDSKSSWEEVTKAAKEYADQLEKGRSTTLQAIQDEARATAGRFLSAEASRQALLADLERQQAEFGSILAPQGYQAEQARMEGQLAARIVEIKKTIAELRRASGEVVIKAADEISRLQTDPGAKLKAGFDILRDQARATIGDTNALSERLTVIGRQQLEAEERLNKERREGNKILEWQKVTGMEVARMLGTVPNGGGDGTRSAARNKAAGGAKNSYHLIGQAIDIPLTINGRRLTKEGIRAVLEPLGIQIKELLGPGDRGHADHFHIAFDKMRLGPDGVARAVEASRKKIADALEKQIEEARKRADEFDAIMTRMAIAGQQMSADWFAQEGGKSNSDLLGINPAVNEVYVGQLNEIYAGLERIRDLAPDIRLADLFGEAGNAMEGMLGSIDRLAKAQDEYNAKLLMAQKLKEGDERDTAISKLQAAHKGAQLKNTVALIGASKRLFSEQSAGYKILEAAEKAMMIVQLARTAISVAAGAGKIFASLGPFGFPVVAAMLGVMASLGFKGGSSASPSIPTAEELQEAAGTGTVLGDSKAKSNSIANSLEIVAANTNRDLEYSNSMLVALRSIDTGISKLSGSVAKQIQVAGGMFDTSGANLGSSGSSGFLGLFGSSTTRSLWDLGMDLNGASVAQILQNGIDGRTYQIVQQIKKSSGFFGIGGGTKTTYQTSYGEIDTSITEAINDVIYSLRQGLLSAASVVGLDGAAAIIDNFRVEIGRLSFKDMTGQEIEDQLNAVFSKVGDQLAGAVLPALKDMQLVGEGLFETFMRVAREYQVVDVSLRSIGLTFGAVGVSSLAARDNLVQLFGGLDEFVSATDFYRDNFLTEAEKIAPIFAAVTDELARLGLSSVDTIDKFKGVVNGLDLTTQSGRDMYAAMMALAPAFSAVEKYQDKQVKSYQDKIDDLLAYQKQLIGSASAGGFAAIAAKFRATAAAAGQGDLTALGNLKGDSTAYLDAVRDRATSALDVARARAEVMNSVDNSISAAETQIELAQRQIAATQAVVASVEQLNSDLSELQSQVATNTASVARVLTRVTDNDALRITNDDDSPVTVVSA